MLPLYILAFHGSFVRKIRSIVCFSRVMTNMRDRKVYFRHILLFCYGKGKNAVQARKKLRQVYEPCASVKSAF